jgi:branched-chain amino acid aminotransferase
MNVMFIINGTLITPSTSDSILDGITRDSILSLTNEMDMPVEIKKISVDDLEKALKENQVSEAFGTGTAAVVAPIESISINGHNYILPTIDENAFMLRAKKKLMQIRTGVAADKFSWNTIIE